MEGVTIDALAQRGQVILTANATTATITTPVVQTTPPTVGVVNWSGEGEQSASAMKIEFFGVGSDTNTGLANVYGWEEVIDPLSTTSGFLWIPTLLASFSFELDSNKTGVQNTVIPATNFFATTITLTTGNAGVDVDVISPGHGNDIAHVFMSSKGARKVQILFGLNSSSTSLNAVIKRA